MADNSSSSDDEYDSNFTSKINLPQLSIPQLGRQPSKSSTNAFVKKAGKKFTSASNKSVRFPDQTRSRDTVISQESGPRYSSDSDSSYSEIIHPGDPRTPTVELPSFQFQPQTTAKDLELSESDDDEEEEARNRVLELHKFNKHYEYSDSEEEQAQGEEVARKGSRGETDITDQTRGPSHGPGTEAARRSGSISELARRTGSISELSRRPGSISSSTRTGDSETTRKPALRDFIRRITLANQAFSAPEYAREAEEAEIQPMSDTFLGRVLQAGSTGGGISGGGLVPGASHHSREKHTDEEQEVGGGSIEMKRLDFSQVNDEAKNLISIHVPGAAEVLASHEESSSSHHSDQQEKSPFSEAESPEQFYQPNPDYNVASGVVDDINDDDYLLLDGDDDTSYIAPPKQVHAGVLSSLLKLYQNQEAEKSAVSLSTGPTMVNDDIYDDNSVNMYESKSSSTVDFTKLKSGIKKGGKMAKNLPGKLSHVGSHSKKSSDETVDEKEWYVDNNGDELNLPSFQNARPKAFKKTSTNAKKAPQLGRKLKQHKKQQQERLRITVHIADILQRQRFIMRMCRALMLFGAPTHRLEEYMVMTSRVLEIDGQFIYFPGCMIVAFGDAATRTSEVHLIRCTQGLNLSKLSDTHAIYKGVIHDLIGVEDAAAKLEELLKKRNRYSPWMCVFFYGLGSAAVCPFAFSGNWYDVPIAFGIGLCVGYLQFFVSSISNLYSSVFEVTASIVVSFIARAIGSIHGGNTFCFGAIAQGSLALILPGYIILCGSLELQSKNLVAGSVRMFYAIIYSLFLGFGITLGAALYGWVDSSATDKATCDDGHSIDDKWRILFVPLFSTCLGLINQARWRQIPVMVVIASIGYIGTYFAGKHFQEVTEFTAAIGAFIIGILGNMYSRIWKGMAVSAMLPAIFVQVPSGIASKSTLLSGIDSANQITHSNSSTTTSTSSTDVSSLSFGATMVEVSIGISVGLFAAALVVYPFGKRKTSLFTL